METGECICSYVAKWLLVTGCLLHKHTQLRALRVEDKLWSGVVMALKYVFSSRATPPRTFFPRPHSFFIKIARGLLALGVGPLGANRLVTQG